MKNYILALMLVPFLLFGQKFKNSELITENKEGDKKGRSIAVETVPRLLSYLTCTFYDYKLSDIFVA